MRSFETTTYGKWILSGEHAVLRGSAALAFPLTSRSLKLGFVPHSKTMDVHFSGPHGEDLRLLFFGVIEHALKLLGVRDPLSGEFHIENSIPVGAGLGASAALCGAVARWCETQELISKNDIYEFARGLENLFHGESSGVDLAVSLSGEGVRFVRGGEPRPIQCVWKPNLFLSFSGVRGMTSDCVAKVKRLAQAQPDLAAKIDLKMAESVALAEMALASTDSMRDEQLTRAIQMGGECFVNWGLCQGDLGFHMSRLNELGALAVKPTGSGGGGYVLSLWENPPSSSARDIEFLSAL